MDETIIDPDQPLSCILVSTLFQPLSSQAIVALLVALALLIVSLFLSAAEIAFFSLTPGQVRGLRTSSDYRSRLLSNQLERPAHLMATMMILRNVVHIAIVILLAVAAARLFHPEAHPGLALVILIVVIALLILLFSELIPSTFAARNAYGMARIMAPPVFFLANIVYPLVALLVSTSTLIQRRLSQRRQSQEEAELTETIEMVKDKSTPVEERKMLKGIVRFGDIEVKEIMRSRMDVTAVEAKTSLKELLATIISSGYSRIPVYEGTFDSILGILYVKDLLPHLEKDESFEWINLIRPPFFIPENQRINVLLTEFQQKKIHMAIVVDEYGGTSGIVTLEDIIEEIVGEINDEYDIEGEELAYTRLDERTFVFEGKTSLNDFCKIIEIDDTVFDEIKGESDTLAGLILEIIGKLPHKGERIDWGEFSFRIEAVDSRRIKRIKVHIHDETAADD